MDGLTNIRQEDLLHLEKLYEVDRPLHIVTTVAIGHFIERFKSKPEWLNIVKFCSLNENWKESGTFVMINTNDDHILFDTLEPSPHESLRKTLELINYDKPMVFICFRDIFRPVVLDVIRVQNLEITFDSGTKVISYQQHRRNPQHLLKRLNKIEPPDGFYLADLKESDVEQMNSMWPQRYSRSIQFLSNCIAQNPSTGLFKKKIGELVAWSMMLETGASGNLFVMEEYRRSGIAEIVTLAQTAKIVKLGLDDGVGFIAHQNKASLQLFKKMGSELIDIVSWIGIRPKQPSKVVPLWGHL